jgi:hypothetical protein
MKKVAIIQSGYLPWKGYFDIIHDVDLFVFYDDVLASNKNDWRNRNRIKTNGGVFWMTIPFGSRGDQLICDIQLHDRSWQKKHWDTIQCFYSRAPYYKLYREFFRSFYLDKAWTNLSELNQYLTRHIAREYLGISTEFVDSREYNASLKKLDRLIEILQKTGAELYVSGPSARDYIDEKRFEEARIKLIYKNYDGYPEYPQFYPPFAAGVSIIDLLFHVGPDAPQFIWGWRKSEGDQA